MLGMKTYRKDDFDACRARVEAGLRAYLKHIGKTASQDLEHRFFNDQVAKIAPPTQAPGTDAGTIRKG